MGGFSLPKIKIPSPKQRAGKKGQLCIGLDIGSHAIKICQMADTGKGYRLLSLGSAVLPPGAVEEGTLQDPEVVARTIAALIKNLKIKDKRVAISVSGYSVIVKKINLSVMDDQELDNYIHSEAGQYIPFDLEDVYLDYQNLKTQTPGNDRTDVMLVAAKKEVVDGFLTMLASAGLRIEVVDVDGFALENIYEANYSLSENVALVDIGASKMSINIISRGVSVLARDVVVGSRQLTEQIQHRFGLEFEEAEALKIGRLPAEEKHQELEQIFTTTCTQWALELKKAIDLFYSNHPGATLGKIALSGGGTRVKGLERFFSEETGITVEIFNPFAKIATDPGKIDTMYLRYVAPEMVIATGLATRPTVL